MKYAVYQVLMYLAFIVYQTLREKCPHTEFFWSVFSCIRTEYRDLYRKSPHLVRIQENTDQKKLLIWTLFTQWKLDPVVPGFSTIYSHSLWWYLVFEWNMCRFVKGFWSAFSCIQSEYRKIRTRNNYVFGHFSRSVRMDVRFFVRLWFEMAYLLMTSIWRSPIFHWHCANVSGSSYLQRLDYGTHKLSSMASNLKWFWKSETDWNWCPTFLFLKPLKGSRSVNATGENTFT